MRLDAISTPPANAVISATKPGAVPEKAPEVSEGDVIHAKVLSVGDETASLRTSDGILLQARLENGVMLSPGADVYLLVRDSSSDVVVMSAVNPGFETATATHQITSDPLLAEIFEQLVSLGYEPEAEMMSSVEQLLTEVPDMPVREAAFFAAQKLPPEPAIQNAFRAVTAGENDTTSMLDALATASASLAEAPPRNAASSAATNSLPAPETFSEAAVPVVITDIIIPESLENVPDIATMTPEAQARTDVPQLTEETALPEFGRWLLETLGTEVSRSDTTSAPVLTAQDLGGSPLLDGLSERSLAGMAESLNRIADSIPKASSETELFENISKFTKELFVRLDGKDDVGIQERLKEVREDLYIKLAYFRDAVASSGAASKEVVLEQTQKLMDHLRLLNGLDQFVCVQIPVQLGDRNKNADLYIYKRKKNGTPRIDPENVKILSALELTHMGKLETLIEISGRDVSLRFDVESDDVAGAIRQNSARIHQLLDSVGYKFTGSSFSTRKSDTTIETALLSLLETERVRGEVDIFL